MNKQPALVISCISCVLAGAALVQLHTVKSQLDDLKNQNAQYYSLLQDGIGSISASVSSQLEQEQNLFAKSDYTYGAVNAENGTILLTYRAVPKEYTPGVTKAEFHIGSALFPMDYENGIFTANAVLPLFGETSGAFITLQDGERLRTQALSDYFNPEYEAIPDIYINCYGSTTYTPDSGTLTVTKQQPVSISFGDAAPDVKSIVFTAEVNGKEIDRMPLDLGESGQAAVLENKLWQDTDVSHDNAAYYAVLDKDYSVPAGQRLAVYADVELANGLLCRMLVDTIEADQNGQPVDGRDDFMYYYGRPRYVYYAPTHKLLWDAVLGEANRN